MGRNEFDLGEQFQESYDDFGTEECHVIRYSKSGGSAYGGSYPKETELFPEERYPIIIQNLNQNRIGSWYGPQVQKAAAVLDEKRLGVNIMTSGKLVMVKGIQLQKEDLIEYPIGSGKTFHVGIASLQWDTIHEISQCIVQM